MWRHGAGLETDAEQMWALCVSPLNYKETVQCQDTGGFENSEQWEVSPGCA